MPDDRFHLQKRVITRLKVIQDVSFSSIKDVLLKMLNARGFGFCFRIMYAPCILDNYVIGESSIARSKSSY